MVRLPPKVKPKASSPEKVDHLPNGDLELVTKGEALLMLACGGGRGPLTRVPQRQRQALDMPPRHMQSGHSLPVSLKELTTCRMTEKNQAFSFMKLARM